MENIFWVVKDEEGVLRPQAGIWRDSAAGQISVETARRLGNKIVKIKIEEI